MVLPDPTGSFGLQEIDTALSSTDAAFAYARQGLKVTWVHAPVFGEEGVICTCKKVCNSQGKHPIAKSWQKIATSDLDVLRDQLSNLRVSEPNVGVVLGEQTGGQYLIAIDIDSEERFAELSEELGELPDTVQSISGSGRGYHLFFEAPTEVAPGGMSNGVIGDAPGVDAKVRNGQVVVAPSIHKSGKKYEWKQFGAFARLPVTWALSLVKREPPKWIHEYTPQTIRDNTKAKKRAEGYLEKAVTEDCCALASCGEGLRNNHLYDRAIRLFYLCGQLLIGARWSYVHDELFRAATACGLKPQEVRKTIDSADKAIRAKNVVRMPVALADPPSGTFSAAPPATLSSDDPLSSIRLQDDRGSPAKTAGNVAILLAEHPVWAGGPAFDAYSQTEIWPEPIPAPIASIHRAEREIVDADHAAIQEWVLSLPVSHRVRAGLDVVAVGVHLASARRRIDLLREWVEALPKWDEKPRLDTWPSMYLGCEKNTYIQVTGRAWLTAVIERALTPGGLVDVAPVLEGPQRSGKNRALETLFAGGPSWAPWLCGVRGDAMDSDNAKRIACSRWILQDDEMRAREPKYLDAIKSWHSRTQETFRLPYAREITVAKRRGLLISNTDKRHYLHDEAGNRRWWPWRTGRIAIEKLSRDRLQLLSEALVAVRGGARWRDGVTDTVYLEALRVSDERRLVDPLLEQIHTLIETGSFRGIQKPSVLTTQTIGTALGYGIDKIDRAFETRVGAAMHELKFIAVRQTIGEKMRVRAYVPENVGQVDPTLDEERLAIADE